MLAHFQNKAPASRQHGNKPTYLHTWHKICRPQVYGLRSAIVNLWPANFMPCVHQNIILGIEYILCDNTAISQHDAHHFFQALKVVWEEPVEVFGGARLAWEVFPGAARGIQLQSTLHLKPCCKMWRNMFCNILLPRLLDCSSNSGLHMTGAIP